MIGLDSRNVAVLRERRAQQLVERDEWNRHAPRGRAKGKGVAD